MHKNGDHALRSLSIGILIATHLVASLKADDWHRWRGPNLNGVSAETAWLDTWPDQGPSIIWKTMVGTGFSSTSVARGRLYTMGNEDNTETVYCLDAVTGKELWTHSYACALDDRFFAGGPTSTPTVDAGSVYTLSRQGHLICFEAASGEVLWSKNIQTETGVRIPGWGFAGSPLVHENLLLLNVGEAGTAVEKTTGKLIWTSADRDAGYATPVPLRQDGRWAAVIASGTAYLAVDIKTGKQLWRHRWLTRFGCNAADPIVDDDYVFLSSGYNRGVALLKMARDRPSVIWAHKELQNQLNSSVLIDVFLYGIDGNAGSKTRLKCLEWLTGEVRWTQDGIGCGSLMAADGKLIVLSERGELIIARASPKGFVALARAQVVSGRCWTVPVLAQGRIYCRSADGELVCVDVRSSN